jgi:hypothetical protein
MLSGNYFIFSQEISEKRDIAIFKLSYYDMGIPNEVLGSIDAEIRNVFVNLGRFNVMAMTYRLGSSNVMDFINKIKSYKKDNVEIPEEVALGQMIFTYEDLEQIISSFIVIIPAVTYFDVRVDRDDEDLFLGFDVTMKTSFSILNVDTMVLEKEIIIETSGYSEDRDEAILQAIEEIAGDLEFQIKSVPIFTIKTGVLEVYSGGVTLQMGRDMGIKRGFEFVILSEQVLKSGHTRSRETGLVLVNTVDEEVSEATVLYGDPQEGDQLKEVPRVGVEGQVYVHALVDLGTDTITLTPGLRTTAAMGVYNIRPFLGLEIPIVISTDPDVSFIMEDFYSRGLPLNAYLGAEYTTYIKRLQLTAAGAAGASFIPVLDENSPDYPVLLTHFGLKAMLSVSYLFARDFKFTVDAGYAHWFGFDEAYYSYTGVLAGAGFIWKL